MLLVFGLTGMSRITSVQHQLSVISHKGQLANQKTTDSNTVDVTALQILSII